MKKYTAVGAIETQNKIIENMMKPYQCMLNNYVNSFADDIRIGTANLFYFTSNSKCFSANGNAVCKRKNTADNS